MRAVAYFNLYLGCPFTSSIGATSGLNMQVAGPIGVFGFARYERLVGDAGKSPIVREIGSLTAALGGLDGLVFTGGIGQRDAKTRTEVVAGCGWLGATIDEEANSAAKDRIDASS